MLNIFEKEIEYNSITEIIFFKISKNSLKTTESPCIRIVLSANGFCSHLVCTLCLYTYIILSVILFQVVAGASVFFICMSVVSFCLKTHPGMRVDCRTVPDPPPNCTEPHPYFHTVDHLCNAWFTFELSVRLIVSTKFFKFQYHCTGKVWKDEDIFETPQYMAKSLWLFVLNRPVILNFLFSVLPNLWFLIQYR